MPLFIQNDPFKSPGENRFPNDKSLLVRQTNTDSAKGNDSMTEIQTIRDYVRKFSSPTNSCQYHKDQSIIYANYILGLVFQRAHCLNTE